MVIRCFLISVVMVLFAKYEVIGLNAKNGGLKTLKDVVVQSFRLDYLQTIVNYG